MLRSPRINQNICRQKDHIPAFDVTKPATQHPVSPGLLAFVLISPHIIPDEAWNTVARESRQHEFTYLDDVKYRHFSAPAPPPGDRDSHFRVPELHAPRFPRFHSWMLLVNSGVERFMIGHRGGDMPRCTYVP